MTRKTRIVMLVLAGAFAATGLIALAGDLDPPVGPITPTMKSLDEVEPRIAINATNTPGDADSLFRITLPGSYYLTGNITGVVGKHGIEIVASGVTLDLNGFDLVGVPGMGAFDGVSVTLGGLTNIAVVNGSVHNWGDEGLDLGTFGALNCRVEGLLASGNAGNGISTSIGSTVSNCAALQNTGTGISTSSGCTVSNCAVNENTGHGISTNSACTITNCSAFINTVHGISTFNGCTVTHCSASFNTGTGIITSAGSTVNNCSAYQNTGNGISTSSGCTVTNCSATINTVNGISTSNGCTVTNCSAHGNTANGIRISSDCQVVGNLCNANGSGGDGAGIHATSADNRIEGNVCTDSDRGIDVDLSGNFITRNTCSGNTTNNWDIVAGNVCLVVQGVPGAAILGNTGGAAPGSTDPNANFTY